MKILKVYVSQPMNGKSAEEIKSEREDVREHIEEQVVDTEVRLLDSFDDGYTGEHPLQYLGYGIQKMSEADVVYMCKDWEYARGCRIEHQCAIDYGIEIVYG